MPQHESQKETAKARPDTRGIPQATEALRGHALRHWIALCEAASLEFLARRDDPGTLTDYRLRTEPCPKHGDHCLRLICGVMLQHVRWESVEPAQAALELLTTFLPASRGVSPQRAGTTQQGPTPAPSIGCSPLLALGVQAQPSRFLGRAGLRRASETRTKLGDSAVFDVRL